MILSWLVPFAFYGVPEGRIRNIALEWPGFVSIYAIFFINLTFCVIKRIRILIKQIKKTPEPPGSVEEISSRKNYLRFKVENNTDVLECLSNFFKKKLYHIRRENNGLIAYRNRFSPLGNLIFHLSFYLLLIATLLSSIDTFIGQIIIPEGFSFHGEKKEIYLI